MSTQQGLQREVDRLTAALAERDRELASLRGAAHLDLDASTDRTPIVRLENQEVFSTHAAESFEDTLRVMGLRARQMLGAHQSAISYVPDGDFRAAIHIASLSDKYAKYRAYDVMPTGEGIWGLIVKNHQPVRMTEEVLYAHPQFKHFSYLKTVEGLEHPPMPGWLAVPVLRKGDGLIGVIQLSDKFEGEFTEDDKEQLVKLATLYTPIFELQYVNDDLQRQATSLRQATQELQRSNAELEQFAYVASHDLQEPLRMVTSYLQLLERRYKANLDQDASDFIAFAVDGAARMQTLIQDLLTYSRVGTRGASFEPTDCQSVLEQALMNLEVAIAESDAEVSSGPMPSLSADASQLAQLMQNLIGNAIKFRGDSPPRIQVEAEQRSDHWLFWVRDNGIGIDPQYSDRIFQVFQRLHGIGQYPGTGIGLAVCKKIVERHQGSIWVESQPDAGATFCFTIPLHLDSLPDSDPAAALTGPAG